MVHKVKEVEANSYVLVEKEPKFKCYFYGKGFENPNYLSKHAKEIHNATKPFKCHDCGTLFDNNFTMKLHQSSKACEKEKALKYNEKPKKLNCRSCDDTFSSEFLRNQHIDKEHAEIQHQYSEYSCQFCDKSITGIGGLETHVQKIHGLPRAKQCQKCERSFITDQAVKYHTETSHIEKEKPFEVIEVGGDEMAKCKFCDKTWRISIPNVTVLQHIIDFHPTRAENSVPCDQCDRAFASDGLLKLHLKFQHGYGQTKSDKIKENWCKTCEKGFSSKNGLEGHILNIHEPEKKLQCEKCPRRFSQASQFRKHVANNCKTVKPWICNLCGKAYENKSHLRDHKVHTQCGNLRILWLSDLT